MGIVSENKKYLAEQEFYLFLRLDFSLFRAMAVFPISRSSSGNARRNGASIFRFN
jgi:hypothetical protein